MNKEKQDKRYNNKKQRKIVIAVLIVLITLASIVPIIQIIEEPTIVGYSIKSSVMKLFIRDVVNSTCSGFFYEGWNLISIPCNVSDSSITNVLSSISGNYSSVHNYEVNDDLDPWKTYNPSLPSWATNDLTNIDKESGYWINMKNESSFSINGILESPVYVTLYRGWNLIGYPDNETKNITLALDSIDGNYNVIFLYNGSNGTYYYYNSTSQNGTLDYIVPGYGYWINMSQADSLFVT